MGESEERKRKERGIHVSGPDLQQLYMRGLRFTGLICVLLFSLTSCISIQNRPDTTTLGGKEGIIVFRVILQGAAYQIHLEKYSQSRFLVGLKSSTFGPLKGFQLESNNNFFVETLSAGEYMWSKILVGFNYYDIIGTNHFTIEPGKINYVGDLLVSTENERFNVVVLNNSREIAGLLTNAYPRTWKGFPYVENITRFERRN